MTPEQIRAERTMVEYELAISKGTATEIKAVRERIVSALTALYTNQNATNTELLRLQDEVNALTYQNRLLQKEIEDFRERYRAALDEWNKDQDAAKEQP